MKLMNIVFAIIALAIHIKGVLAEAPSILASYSSSIEGGEFGSSLAIAGDINQDGVDDLLIGVPQATLAAKHEGFAILYSGANILDQIGAGSPLGSFPGGYQNASGGSVVTTFGDTTGDGIPEILIGSPGNSSFGKSTGQVEVWSVGFSEEKLVKLLGNPQDAAGSAIAHAGDFDGNGLADIIFSLPGDDDSGKNSGKVKVVSGVTGQSFLTITGHPGDQIGTSLAAVTNSSGRTDAIVVGSAYAQSNFPFSGKVDFYNTDGSLRATLVGEGSKDLLGQVMVSGVDVNRDGFSDVLVSAPGAAKQRGQVNLISGADGNSLLRIQGSKNGGRFGTALAFVPDLDGDTIPDIATSAPYEGAGGKVYVLSSITGKVLEAISGEKKTGFGLSLAGLVGKSDKRLLIIGQPFSGNKNNGEISVYPLTKGCHGDTKNITTQSGKYVGKISLSQCINPNGTTELEISGPIGTFAEVYRSEKKAKKLKKNKNEICTWHLTKENLVTKGPKYLVHHGQDTISLSLGDLGLGGKKKGSYLQVRYKDPGTAAEIGCSEPIKLILNNKPTVVQY